jgi:hypothetical protein
MLKKIAEVDIFYRFQHPPLRMWVAGSTILAPAQYSGWLLPISRHLPETGICPAATAVLTRVIMNAATAIRFPVFGTDTQPIFL